jgi:hypothetical protein
MPFQKGRQKTGGRTKGGAPRRWKRFLDQLSGAGFSYVRELAQTLLEIRDLRKNAPDPVRAAELKFYYGELKSLLPYMAPKLRDKEVEIDAAPPEPTIPESAISTKDLLSVFADNGKETAVHQKPSDSPPLGTRSAELQLPASAEEDLRGLAGEQEEDA